MKFEDRFQQEIERQERCACGDSWRLAKSSLLLKEKDKTTFFLTYLRMVSPSAILNKARGNKICCRFRSINAHVEQERPELCRIGNLEHFLKSDDGCYSQRRSAKEEATVYVKELDLFVTESFLEIHRPFSCSWNSTKITDIPPSGPVVKLIKDGRRIKCSLSTSCSSSATPTSPTSVLQEAVVPTLHPATSAGSAVGLQSEHDNWKNERRQWRQVQQNERTSHHYGKKDDHAGRYKQQRERDECERHGRQQDTRRPEPEKSRSDRIPRRHDRTRSTRRTERKHKLRWECQRIKIEIKCPAKPITHAFLQFTDNDERDKFVRSANILKKEMRGRRNKDITIHGCRRNIS